MKRSLSLCGVCALMVFLCQQAAAMNGRAAAVVTLLKSPRANQSRLIVSTVVGRSVSVDTILQNGVFYFPTLSFDGRRIAFFRNNAGVSIIDIDGNNLRTVAKTINWGWGDQEQTMAWPGSEGGKWVYYHKPSMAGFRNGSGEIWKVNVDDTSQNSLVCDYKKTDANPDAGWYAPGLWKWSLSADAQYCVTHTNGSSENLGWNGTNNAIVPHLFPPRVDPATGWINPRLTAASGGGLTGNCNSGLSASGKLVYYFSGAHNQLYCKSWDHATNAITGQYAIGTGSSSSMDQFRDIPGWLAPGGLAMGDAFVYPRGVSNSDQIVSVVVIWRYSDQFTQSGGNLLIANWKDKEAVYVTNNPEIPPPPPDTPYWYSEPGDFWLDNTGHRGCYMDISGNWIKVPGADTTDATATVIPGVASGRGFRSAGAISAVYDLKGARIGDRVSCDPARLRCGGYVVIDQAGARKMLMARGGDMLP